MAIEHARHRRQDLGLRDVQLRVDRREILRQRFVVVTVLDGLLKRLERLIEDSPLEERPSQDKGPRAGMLRNPHHIAAFTIATFFGFTGAQITKDAAT